MTFPKLKNEWLKFLDELNELNDYVNPEETFYVMQKFVQDKLRRLLPKDILMTYHNLNYADLNVTIYPARYSSLKGSEFAAFKHVSERVPNPSMDFLASYIQQKLEQILLLKVESQCSVCGFNESYVWMEESTNKLVLECNQCYFSRYIDGSSAQKTKLIPPTLTILEKNNIIEVNQ